MNPALCPDDEKVGVARIRMTQPSLHSTVVLGSFFGVDKLLHGWSLRLNGRFDCTFEIAFHDGRTISGVYHFRRQGDRRPALMSFVRASLAAMGRGDGQPGALQGLGEPDASDAPGEFLAHYELDDFGQPAAARAVS